MDAAANMLELRSISKRYGDKQVLYPVDLDVPRGKVVALLGQSGCGKSTLLRIIMGLVKPSAGTVVFDGKEMAELPLLETRRKIGYVIQEGGLFPHLTAHDNIAIVAKYLRWSARRIDQRMSELAELTHLDADLLKRYPSQLSGGQRQRLGLMRALMLDPALLLLDEPLGALDPMIRSELQEDLREIFRQLDKSVIVVTHDLHEAAFLADIVVLLKDGRIVQQGPITDLINHPSDEFVHRFINAQRSALPAGGK